MAKMAIAIILMVLIGFVYIAFQGPSGTRASRVELDDIRTSVQPFQPPQPGDRIRIELVTGVSREGIIRDVDRDSVVIGTPHGEATYPRHTIAPASRTLLFRADHEGIPYDERPATIMDEDLARLLTSEDTSPDELGFAPNVQYVISGTNAIVIYGSHEAR